MTMKEAECEVHARGDGDTDGVRKGFTEVNVEGYMEVL
jgi:hypothetical protein